MTNKVKLSPVSIVLTIANEIFLISFGIIHFYDGNIATGIIFSALFITINALALLYYPVEIKATDTELEIHHLLSHKSVRYQDISSIFICPSTLAERRIFASGGFFGYWGWFSEQPLGKYFAYYGKASDCFMVNLKSGVKYRLGCTDAPQMVQFISSKINSL